MRAILFDIDGTLTTTVSGQTFKQHPRDVLPMQGVIEGLNYYYNQNPKWELIGISNQGGVAAGYKSIADTVAEMQYTLELLPQLSFIYFCPDFDGDLLYKVSAQNYEVWDRYLFVDPNTNIPCYQSFRKPGSGMLRRAIHDLPGLPDQVWMIGDRSEDEQAAAAANINFMWADIWHERFNSGIYEVKNLDSVERENSAYEPVMSEVLRNSLTESSERINKGEVRDWLNSLIDEE